VKNMGKGLRKKEKVGGCENNEVRRIKGKETKVMLENKCL
jgi:hypothetical protein